MIFWSAMMPSLTAWPATAFQAFHADCSQLLELNPSVSPMRFLEVSPLAGPSCASAGLKLKSATAAAAHRSGSILGMFVLPVGTSDLVPFLPDYDASGPTIGSQAR